MVVDESLLLRLLERFEAHWRRQDAAIAHALQPGLTDEEIDDLILPLGLQLPVELRIWWRWHNGSEPVEDIGPGGWQYQPLSLAVDYCTYLRRSAGSPIDPTIPALREAYWHDSWFPVTTLGGSRHVLYVDTAGISINAPAPIRFLDTGMWDEFLVERTASFTDAVALWVDALDRGYYWWNPDDGGRWDDRYGEIPLEARARGLM